MLDLLRLVRFAAQTVVRAVTTAILLALLDGGAIKLKAFGNGP
jgi:nucleoid DNA-binding protein